MIDLATLVHHRQTSNIEDESLSDTPDTDSLLLLPSSKDVGWKVSSAFGALHLYRREIGRLETCQTRQTDHTRQTCQTKSQPNLELEAMLGKRWAGKMLRCGQIFDLHGSYFLSLGFHGYAALVVPVKRISLPKGDAIIFSLSDSEFQTKYFFVVLIDFF